MSAPRVDIVGLRPATVDIVTLVSQLLGRDEAFQLRSILLEDGGPVATARLTDLPHTAL